jgi:hypothetical protein
MESRMRGNSHVRFGAGDEETCLGNGARRFIPTLPADPVRTLTLNGGDAARTLEQTDCASVRLSLRQGWKPEG